VKLYLSCDMEGISGIPSWRLASSSRPNYAEGRRLMTGDVNAVIEAAFEAGADEVWVKDAHGSAHNLLIEELDDRAQVLQGWTEPAMMMSGLDDSFDAALLVGYHARAGTPDGLMCHTFSDHYRNVRVNGKVIGETGLSALHAGTLGVPIVALTGDDAVCREAAELMPWVATATVKWALAREAARMLPLPQARAAIREAVQLGLEALAAGKAQPLRFDEPLRVEIDLAHGVEAYRLVQLHGAELVAPSTVAFEVENGEALARLIGRIF